MSNKLSYQDMILQLLEFWKEQGCVIWNPYNIQVGAGTMNPATALRVLGPEPWNVVYVEPSIRPDDGRFGENPNRMQLFYQLQVILKPDPGNPQELYEQSLMHIGIDLRRHDLRYVEDNWESPALGAWGLGWEVWLDGQEITQFTYFQQSGGITLDPVSVEITYGLDRIALALQDVEAVWQLDWGVGVPYQDLLLQSEIEHSRYYFNVADVDALRAVYDTYENEARRCLEAGLVIPAHDYNLKCSHLFNVLDTRGAIGVTERARYFRRMRDIAHDISNQYVDQRRLREFPLTDNPHWQANGQPVAAAETIPAAPQSGPQTFLLEVGVEELPVSDFSGAVTQWQKNVPDLLAELRLDYDRVEVLGTPRRLAVIVYGLAERQTDLEMEVKGPPAERAYDAHGAPTKAAEGFARSKGVSLADLHMVEEGDKRYVSARIREIGKPAHDVLTAALPDLIAGLRFEKAMRWNQTNVSFSRPIRWLVALVGAQVVRFSHAGVTAGRVSRGLRPRQSPPITMAQADDYLELMTAHGIMVDPAERRAAILAEAVRLSAEQGGVIPDDEDLLQEVASLVEQPTVLLGSFGERYLQLPPEVLVAVMRKHQRYFPVFTKRRKLLPYFITVRNGDSEHLDIVRAGNEHVIHARFTDAEFFYKKDITRPLPAFVPELEQLTVEARLGSMLDKTRRLEKLTSWIGAMLDLSPAELKIAARAAELAKADLATAMVVEMTSLQGVMGGHYALLSGEEPAVARAIAEQYDAVSRSRPGLALALADRLDSLTGLTAAGLAPKGSNDPFALRRAAIQIVENLIGNEIPFDLSQAVAYAAALLPVPADAAACAQVEAFIAGRLEVLLRERDIPASIVKAVLAEQAGDPYSASRTSAALLAATRLPDWSLLLDNYARCVRIVRGHETLYPLRSDALVEPAERSLLLAYEQALQAQDGTFVTLLESLRYLKPAISEFFDEILVMADDQTVRENRLALLQRIAGLTAGIADLSYLEGF